MGTYALSSGYYDAYYKRAQQVRTLIQREMAAALAAAGGVDALITPAAPTVAYRLGEKVADPLAMYVGDLMTVNVNLAGEHPTVPRRPANDRPAVPMIALMLCGAISGITSVAPQELCCS